MLHISNIWSCLTLGLQMFTVHLTICTADPAWKVRDAWRPHFTRPNATTTWMSRAPFQTAFQRKGEPAMTKKAWCFWDHLSFSLHMEAPLQGGHCRGRIFHVSAGEWSHVMHDAWQISRNNSWTDVGAMAKNRTWDSPWFVPSNQLSHNSIITHVSNQANGKKNKPAWCQNGWTQNTLNHHSL